MLLLDCTEDFAREQFLRLLMLPVCSRCADTERDRHLKCLDTGFTVDERRAIQCGCSCWSASVLMEILAGVN